MAIFGKIRSGIRKELSTVDRLLLYIGLAFCFFTMFYADITITSQFGCVFLDSLFDLKPFSFYYNAMNSGIAPEGAVYDIGAYIIFGIWSLPIWILKRLFGVSVLSAWSLLWYKALVVVFLLGSGYYLYRIVQVLIGDETVAASSVIMFFIAPMTFMPTFVAAQYDVIALFFMLAGVYYYLTKDVKRWRIFMAVALIIKPFPIFLLFLMIVWRYKNVFVIVKELLLTCSLFLVCKLLYLPNSGYADSAGGFMKSHIAQLFESGIMGGFGNVSFFIMALVIIYVVAYVHDFDNNMVLIVLAYGIWAAFCMFGSIYPYWIIYFAPFAVIVTCGYILNNRLLIVDLAANVCLIVALILKYSWVYGGAGTYKYLVLKGLCNYGLNDGSGVAVGSVLMKLKFDTMMPAINAIYMAGFLIIGYYGFQAAAGRNTLTVEKKINAWHYRIRILLIWFWSAVTLGTMILSNMGY